MTPNQTNQDYLDRPLMHLFVHIGKLIEDRFRGALSKKGIHVGQARILLALLKHDKLTQKEIADGLHIKPATVTNLVKKMENSELITRKRDANDDRIINVTLSLKGKEASLFAETIIEEIEADIRSKMEGPKVESLRSELLRTRDVLGGSDPKI